MGEGQEFQSFDAVDSRYFPETKFHKIHNAAVAFLLVDAVHEDYIDWLLLVRRCVLPKPLLGLV